MINPNFQAVIFDCDGTLVDSEPITIGVLVDFLQTFDLEISYVDALELFTGRDMRAIVAYLKENFGVEMPAGFCDQFRVRQAQALRESLKPIDGALELLRAMAKPFCLASNAPQDKIAINLEVTKLDEFFSPDRTFSAYDISVWKPQPDLFLHAATKLAIDPAHCVVIEDSIAGIDAGLAAGMQVIGYAPNPDHQPTNKVPFVYSLHDLIEVIGN